MADEKKTGDVEKINDLEIEPLSDAELDSVAGGLAAGLDGSSGSCCTCSGDNCSLTTPVCGPSIGGKTAA